MLCSYFHLGSQVCLAKLEVFWPQVFGQSDPVPRPVAAPKRHRQLLLWRRAQGCHLVGGLEHQFYFPIYWVFNHPNWRSYFSEGWPNHLPAISSWDENRDVFTHGPLGRNSMFYETHAADFSMFDAVMLCLRCIVIVWFFYIWWIWLALCDQ